MTFILSLWNGANGKVDFYSIQRGVCCYGSVHFTPAEVAYLTATAASHILSTKMIEEKTFAEMALSFPGTEQKPHFERQGFKVSGKRMFATYLPENNTANIFLTREEQSVLCQIDAKNIYPVPNKWGEKGATTFVLDKVPPAIIMEALLSAYTDVVKKK